MSQKLTKRVVESVIPLTDKQTILWDSELKGLGIRVYPSGRKLYFIQYRNQFKRSHRIKLGVHGVMTAEQARDMARQLLGDVAKGRDPSTEKRDKNRIPTLNEFAQDYLEIYAKNSKREKSYKEDVRLLNTIILKRLGTKKYSRNNLTGSLFITC